MTTEHTSGYGEDLNALFTTNAADLQATKIFVNRHSEREAFDRAVTRHRELLAGDLYDVQDVLAPRRNVLVYFGVGGIGKTSLSRVLEDRQRRPATVDPRIGHR